MKLSNEVLNAIKEQRGGNMESLENVFKNAKLITTPDKIIAMLEVMGISEEDAILYAGLDPYLYSERDLYEAVIGTFFSEISLVGIKHTISLEHEEALRCIASVYGWQNVSDMWHNTRGFKAENLLELLMDYPKLGTNPKNNLIASIKKLREFNDQNEDISEFITSNAIRYCRRAQKLSENRECKLQVEARWDYKFTVTTLRSTLRRMDDGSWVFHFKGNNKFPEEPPINLGILPLNEVVAFIEKHYAVNYKRPIILGTDILYTLLNSGVGTSEEKAHWQKLYDEAIYYIMEVV